jgi:hypothetical protein
VEGNDHGEAYTAIQRGGLLSRESSNIADLGRSPPRSPCRYHEMRPDWDITTPELKAAWEQGRKDLFYPYGKTYLQTLDEQD